MICVIFFYSFSFSLCVLFIHWYGVVIAAGCNYCLSSLCVHMEISSSSTFVAVIVIIKTTHFLFELNKLNVLLLFGLFDLISLFLWVSMVLLFNFTTSTFWYCYSLFTRSISHYKRLGFLCCLLLSMCSFTHSLSDLFYLSLSSTPHMCIVFMQFSLCFFFIII